jgi:hypothetical protein
MSYDDEEPRDQKVFASVTETMKDKLDRYARRNHWTRSTAVAVLVERGLDADDATRGASDEPS